MRLGANAAAIRQMLDGMWVNTMVLTRPIRRASQPASGYDKALSTLVQKKNRLAADSEMPKRLNSHSASSDCTTKPPANASRLNNAASL